MMRGKLPMKGPALAEETAPHFPASGWLRPTHPQGRNTDIGEEVSDHTGRKYSP